MNAADTTEDRVATLHALLSEARGYAETVRTSLDDCAKLIGAQRQTISELREALSSVLPILDAVKYSYGLGRSQLQRLEAARALVAKTNTGEAT